MINRDGPAGTYAALRASNPAGPPTVMLPLAGPEPGGWAGQVDDDGMLMQHGAQLVDHAERLDRLEGQAHTHDGDGSQ